MRHDLADETDAEQDKGGKKANAETARLFPPCLSFCKIIIRYISLTQFLLCTYVSPQPTCDAKLHSQTGNYRESEICVIFIYTCICCLSLILVHCTSCLLVTASRNLKWEEKNISITKHFYEETIEVEHASMRSLYKHKDTSCACTIWNSSFWFKAVIIQNFNLFK